MLRGNHESDRFYHYSLNRIIFEAGVPLPLLQSTFITMAHYAHANGSFHRDGELLRQVFGGLFHRLIFDRGVFCYFIM